MQPRHVALAVLLSIFWGLNFVIVTIALTDFPPLLLGAVRFVIASLPILLLPRPPVHWTLLIAIGATLFLGQFALLFPAMAVGMPPGLASIGLQMQAFITIGIAATLLGERPTGWQLGGAGVALLGLALIATTVGSDGVTLEGFLLLVAAAGSWAVGNVLLRRAGQVDMMPMIAWLSLVPPVPLFLLSLALEGPHRIAGAITGASWLTIGAVLYIAVVSTTFGYAAWGHLLKLYPASTAAPFSLLVPVSGTISAAVILGEQFGPVRLGGMVFILAGLAVLAFAPRVARIPIDPG